MEVVNALGIMTLRLGILRLARVQDVFATNGDDEDKLQLDGPTLRDSAHHSLSGPRGLTIERIT